MKRGTPDHPKLKRLARTIKLPIYAAVGLLETLWHFTSKFAPAGDVGRFSDADIAEALGWEGDPGALIRALVDSKWLDLNTEHRVIIHDWHEHADDATQMTLARAGKYFANGSMPKMGRFGRTERERIEAAYARHAHDTPTANARHTQKCSPPSHPIPSHPMPSPASDSVVDGVVASALGGASEDLPASSPASPPPAPPAKRGTCTDAQAREIYEAYPRKVDPEAALKAIKAAVKRLARDGNADPVSYLLDRTRAFASSPAGQKPKVGEQDYRKHPKTWFAAGSYANLIDPPEDNPWGNAPRFDSQGIELPPPKNVDDDAIALFGPDTEFVEYTDPAEVKRG